MRAMSNAFLSQVEIEQVGHWEQGPLELAFLDVDDLEMAQDEWVGTVANWNRHYQGGWIRPGDTTERLQSLVPILKTTETPNVFVAPRLNGGDIVKSCVQQLDG